MDEHRAAYLVARDAGLVGRARAIRPVEPDMRAQVSVATHAATPGSVVARAFVTARKGYPSTNSSTRLCRSSRSSTDRVVSVRTGPALRAGRARPWRCEARPQRLRA